MLHMRTHMTTPTAKLSAKPYLLFSAYLKNKISNFSRHLFANSSLQWVATRGATLSDADVQLLYQSSSFAPVHKWEVFDFTVTV